MRRLLKLLPILLAAAACSESSGPPPAETPPTPSPAETSRAIVGGTLLVLGDGVTAVVADHDRDRISVVDLDLRALRHTLSLDAGAQPFRLVEDASGRVHVVLRGAGKLLTLDPSSGTLLGERVVCAEPRGLAFDAAADRIHVACATGELVTFPSGPGDALRTLRLARDLRDVVADGDRLYVSYFKSSEVHALDAEGNLLARHVPTSFQTTARAPTNLAFEPAVAWRLLRHPNGGAVLVHQRGMLDEIDLTLPGGYGEGTCSTGLTHGTLSVVGESGMVSGGAIPFSVLPVDVAVRSDGAAFAVASAASRSVELGGAPEKLGFVKEFGCPQEIPKRIALGEEWEPVAVAFDGAKRVVVQSREPAALLLLSPDGALEGSIELGGTSVADAGHRLFHRQSDLPIACASCHPEGHEDGRIWNFQGFGPRRTQELGGGILATAPFHWQGDLKDLSQLMDVVFVERMGATTYDRAEVDALGTWLDGLTLPKPDPGLDAQQVARGKVLFAGSGCASCHAGERFTNNATEDVGTGRALQVPSLRGVAARGPWMHDGCAKTLRDRFTNPDCGGGDRHGQTSHLGEAQLDDLLAYLRSL